MTKRTEPRLADLISNDGGLTPRQLIELRDLLEDLAKSPQIDQVRTGESK